MENTVDIIMPKSIKAFREFVAFNNKNPLVMAALCITTLRLCQYEKEKGLKKVEILYGSNCVLTRAETEALQSQFHISIDGNCEIDEDEEDVSEYTVTELDIDFNMGKTVMSAKAIMHGFAIFVWLRRNEDETWLLLKHLIMPEEDCANFLAMRHPTESDWILDPSRLGNLTQTHEEQEIDEQLLF